MHFIVRRGTVHFFYSSVIYCWHWHWCYALENLGSAVSFLELSLSSRSSNNQEKHARRNMRWNDVANVHKVEIILLYSQCTFGSILSYSYSYVVNWLQNSAVELQKSLRRFVCNNREVSSSDCFLPENSFDDDAMYIRSNGRIFIFSWENFYWVGQANEIDSSLWKHTSE